jgi:imidazolonepropionase-like amidohydrolase
MIKKVFLTITYKTFVFSLFVQTHITNTTLVDVENKKLIPNQTIKIIDDLITDIKHSSEFSLPADSHVVDGIDKYLIPGLVDAHVHFFQNGGLYTRPDAIDLRKYSSYENEIEIAKSGMETTLRRYLKHGITTVIDVGATYNLLNHRNEFKDKSYSPTIFMTGPLLTTFKPQVYQSLVNDNPFILTKSIKDGINSVKEQLPYNPDFIKIWYIVGVDGLSIKESAYKNLPIVKAIIDEAHRNKLKVAVHATQKITAQLAVENGADFLVHSINDEVLGKDFIELLKKKKVILCPTLMVHSGYNKTFGQKLQFNNRELLESDPYQLGSLLDLRHLEDTLLVNRLNRYANSDKKMLHIKKSDSVSLVNLKLLADAGVLIASGTDAGNIGTLHASSYLGELNAMHKSGMTNWQIIEASSINGAKILDKEEQIGSIDIGKKADLVLLDGNPVENFQNIAKVFRIINKGEVIKPDELLSNSPRALAQRQLNGYNLRNIDAFLEPYDDDVEVYYFPNQLQYVGKETMKEIYSQMFNQISNLHCELKNRIVHNNIVIDKELVRSGDTKKEAVAIYHIEVEKIKRVYFVK